MSDKQENTSELILLAVLLVITVGGLWVFSGFLFSVVADFEAAQWLAAISTLAIAVLTFILAFETLKMRKRQDEQIQYLLRREAAENFYKHQDRFCGAVSKLSPAPHKLKSSEEIHSKLFRINPENGRLDVVLPAEIYSLADFLNKNLDIFKFENQLSIPFLKKDDQKPRFEDIEIFNEKVKERWRVFSDFSSIIFECFQVFFDMEEGRKHKIYSIKEIDIETIDISYDHSIDALRDIEKRLFVFFGWLKKFIYSDFFSLAGVSDQDKKILNILAQIHLDIPSKVNIDKMVQEASSGLLVPLDLLEDGDYIREILQGSASSANKEITGEYELSIVREWFNVNIKPYYHIIYFRLDVPPAP